MKDSRNIPISRTRRIVVNGEVTCDVGDMRYSSNFKPHDGTIWVQDINRQHGWQALRYFNDCWHDDAGRRVDVEVCLPSPHEHLRVVETEIEAFRDRLQAELSRLKQLVRAHADHVSQHYGYTLVADSCGVRYEKDGSQQALASYSELFSRTLLDGEINVGDLMFELD